MATQLRINAAANATKKVTKRFTAKVEVEIECEIEWPADEPFTAEDAEDWFSDEMYGASGVVAQCVRDGDFNVDVGDWSIR